jgi:L-threonylcarbamoyladenylate synthase
LKTEVIKINPTFPETEKIIYCAKVIRQGGLVVFPTETVYGIAADFSNPKAMARLREVKRRSDAKPFAILISQKGLISNYCLSHSTTLYKLVDAFWPGPLTMIVPAKEEGSTIGVRMPDHNIALRLVRESQCTVAAPSANFEGNPAPTTCEEALKDLNGLVDVAIDGGPVSIGISSSIVDLTRPNPTVTREGVIKQADIDKVAKRKTVLFVCTGNSCRSVMAEYMFRSMMAGRADVETVSAGTGVFIQSTASNETISVLKEQGVDATRHRSQPVSHILLKKADLIFVMTQTHRLQVLDRVPEVEKRVYLLKEFANISPSFIGDLDIPDPIGKSHQDYKDCLVVIKEALHKIIQLI